MNSEIGSCSSVENLSPCFVLSLLDRGVPLSMFRYSSHDLSNLLSADHLALGGKRVSAALRSELVDAMIASAASVEEACVALNTIRSWARDDHDLSQKLPVAIERTRTFAQKVLMNELADLKALRSVYENTFDIFPEHLNAELRLIAMSTNRGELLGKLQYLGNSHFAEQIRIVAYRRLLEIATEPGHVQTLLREHNVESALRAEAKARLNELSQGALLPKVESLQGMAKFLAGSPIGNDARAIAVAKYKALGRTAIDAHKASLESGTQPRHSFRELHRWLAQDTELQVEMNELWAEHIRAKLSIAKTAEEFRKTVNLARPKSSELGEAVRAFAKSTGNFDSLWHVVTATDAKHRVARDDQHSVLVNLIALANAGKQFQRLHEYVSRDWRNDQNLVEGGWAAYLHLKYCVGDLSAASILEQLFEYIRLLPVEMLDVVDTYSALLHQQFEVQLATATTQRELQSLFYTVGDDEVFSAKIAERFQEIQS